MKGRRQCKKSSYKCGEIKVRMK